MNQKEQIEKDVAQIRGFLGIVEGMFGPAVNPSKEALARLASALTTPQPEIPVYMADWWRKVTEDAEQTVEYWRQAFFDMRDIFKEATKTPQPEASDREIAHNIRLSVIKMISETLPKIRNEEASRKIVDANENDVIAYLSTIRADERRKAEAERCTWTEESGPDYSGVWNTSCGEAFVYENGMPAENGARFCQHCGKPLKFKPYIPDEDDLS